MYVLSLSIFDNEATGTRTTYEIAPPPDRRGGGVCTYKASQRVNGIHVRSHVYLVVTTATAALWVR